jgi:SAM-dependent methyltransferase
MKMTAATAPYSKADASDEVASGTKQEADALRGKGLLQSPEEWEARNRELAASINQLLARHLSGRTRRGLDVGCMDGELTDRYGSKLGLEWCGIDPDLTQTKRSDKGAVLSHGFAHQLDFPDGHFDCIVFANVYEHIPPGLRVESLRELHRVLAPGGIVVGQLPNPYFPIESHSRLPFMGYLPRHVQRWYWRLTPTGWDFDSAHFFSVTMRNLRQVAVRCKFEPVDIRQFNYSAAAIPASVRWIVPLHSRLRLLPWAWQFVLRKSAARGRSSVHRGS